MKIWNKQYHYKYKVYSLWLNEKNKLCICLAYTNKIKLICKLWTLFHDRNYWHIITKEYIIL